MLLSGAVKNRRPLVSLASRGCQEPDQNMSKGKQCVRACVCVCARAQDSRQVQLALFTRIVAALSTLHHAQETAQPEGVYNYKRLLP